jgi:hypothetical protein
MGVQPFYGKGPHRLLRAGSAKITKWYTEPPKLLSNFCSIFTVYRCGLGPHNTSWRVAVWRPMFLKTQLSNAVLCYTIIQEVHLKTEPRGTARLTALHCHVKYIQCNLKCILAKVLEMISSTLGNACFRRNWNTGKKCCKFPTLFMWFCFFRHENSLYWGVLRIYVVW